ncbi:NO-inducible flavohemoprotein [Paracoccus aerius]|uniref:nitric oxide dioxygenase n=1 Tax=Paracoccus aerius TaxID=1915382 RepID=A0ABS1S9K8_9RHOB|nr:NO-inducible flavohemoprotein [Paracoccus aerius]MBL3675394.1 NO-inducible flavohemoprotein [Paracoccus aerius]GHG33118.1 flavohemoprotein [Paracoccus aerius]
MPRPLSQQTITVVKATVPALEQHGPVITETMYRRLFRNTDIAALFNQANQKKGTQRLALAQAVLAYAQNIENLSVLGAAVERIAQKHIGYAILPEHYPFVAEALLGAMEEVLGDAATPDILQAWGEAYWFLADLLIEREAAIRAKIQAQPGGWTDWRRFVVAERQVEAEGIVSFILRPEDGGLVVPHRPGQYLTLRFDEAGLPGVKRNYSISSIPSDEGYRITVKREPNGEASCFLHDRVPVGIILEATPPAGDFHLAKNPQRPLILLSGGVGLTPIVSMLEVLAEQHRDVPVFYVHGTSSPAHHALDAQVRLAAARHGNVLVETFYESGGDDRAKSGRITINWLRANTPLDDAEVYLCGPRPFLRHFVGGLKDVGIPADRIHYEFFGPADEQLAT